ncbi:DUF2815 family protein [Clostridiales bacterium AF36-10]|nr:DUF2815 family protein [Clostridium sp. AM25-23AC]RJW84130.1 DUF2815 family protein [Clostridiales bacterium AF36-10]
MPPKGHAILSASSSDRWLHCPPSARLCETYEDKGSDYAAEGTDAHELCEYKLKKALGMDASDPTENLTWHNEEMEDCANGYAAYILEMVEAAKESCADPKVLIEQRVDFSRWVEQGFGTADCIIIADGTLRICDYKHGLGVLVDATDNPQMKCYALGALELFDDIYDIDNVSMTIYQPRRQNISTFEISKDALYKWADEVLKPTADLAFAGDGNFLCGEWCGFCKAKHECRARAESNLTLAQYDFKFPPLLEDSEIEYILSRADELVAWASDIKEYALQQAISGKEWAGWKLVEGRSNRKYSNEEAVIQVVTDAGFDPYEKKLLGITAMQKRLGKSRFDELLTAYIEKPQGKPTLVPESDKRPAMNNAKTDFMEENQMNKNVKINNPMKVITGPDTRWSYANVWEPKSINGGTPKYSVSLIIPKSDTKTIAKIEAAIEAAYKEGEAKLKGNGKSVPALSVIKTPLRDGDMERPDDPAYANSYFVNANATSAPGIVDADRNPILTRSEVYSGVYGRASISFYAFNSSGNKGIACGLNNLQKIRDGEPLGGKASAESDFASDEDDDFLD